MTDKEKIKKLEDEIYLYKRDGERLYEGIVRFQQKLDSESRRYEKIRRNALVTFDYCAVIMDLEEQIRIRDYVISEYQNKNPR